MSNCCILIPQNCCHPPYIHIGIFHQADNIISPNSLQAAAAKNPSGQAVQQQVLWRRVGTALARAEAVVGRARGDEVTINILRDLGLCCGKGVQQ